VQEPPDDHTCSRAQRNRMRVLLYSMNFAPEPTGIGKFSGEMAAWMAQRGHEVRVIAAPPYYPNWQIQRNYAWPPYRREEWQGVQVWRAPIWVPKSPSGLARVAHLISFAISSLPLVVSQFFWRPDLVICVAPSFMCAPAALLTARLCRTPCWLHLQDFEIDLAFGTGLLSGEILQRLILAMEAWFLRRFDTVSSISRRMVEKLLMKGVKPEKTRYFPNWADLHHITPSNSGEKYRSQLEISPDATVVLCSGSLGAKQGLMVIPEAAAMLSGRKDIVFVVCGDGVMKPRLQAATAGFSNVRFLALQPVERLGELLCTADIHLLSQNRGAADLVLPSKLSGMLASGRPVIATCGEGTELNAVVSGCGLVVPPEDAAALSQAICQLADHPQLRLELGLKARKYAEANFGREAILEGIFAPMDTEGAHDMEDAGPGDVVISHAVDLRAGQP
jgi:colanic acid biosynthesis glycosyl transferase WcaI